MTKKIDKNNSLESLLNIGPRTAGLLRDININTADELLAQDPYKVIDKLMKFTSPLHCKFILASIAGAHVGIPWHLVMKKTSAEYEKRHPGFEWTKFKA